MVPERLENTDGFTLLELIVSLTILGVIVTIVFGAMRIGVSAWEKGEGDIENQQRYRIVLDRIGQQMASMAVPVDMPQADAVKYLLKGDAASVEFVSRISLMPENRSGLVYVKYEVRTDGEGERSLSCYEQSLARRSADPLENIVEEEDLHVLLPHVKECGFEYFKPSIPEAAGKGPNVAADRNTDIKKNVGADDAGGDGNKAFSWEMSWDPEVEQHNPRAVAMNLQMDDASDPIRIIVPLPGEDRL